jgi:hypothetical protein
MDPGQLVVKEAFVESVETYARHVIILAWFYASLFFISLVGMGVLLSNGKYFITLAQRSNVETLTLAFFLMLFLYIGVISFPGLKGGLRLLYAHCVWGKNRLEQIEKRKISLLSKTRSESSVALNCAVTCEGKSFEIPIRDIYGSLGRMVFKGARLTHIDECSDGSNTLFSFVIAQIVELKKKSGADANLQIVEWGKIDNEETEKYLSQVEFACRLETHFAGEALWPRLQLETSEIEVLRSRLSELCPILRSEAFLPDWEFEGEHKIPVIPEPLGIISLSRTEKRVDPITSMGAILFVLLAALLIFILFVLHHPWVPGI